MLYLLKFVQREYGGIKSILKTNSIKSLLTKSYCQKSLDVNTKVVKDVILYKYDNSRYFKIINLFALCQFGFWTYLSHFAYTTLRDVPVDKSKQTSWWQKINLGENKYRNGIAIVSFIIGWGILSITWMYSLRSVRYLILRKGGNDVTIVTYTPFGHNRMFTLSLNNISCKEIRTAARSQLPIKVKGHYLHYILDMKGEFRNTELFDYTAGLKRSFK